MFGAILGDIIGSPYEFDTYNIKTKEFPLFSKYSTITDDSVMTLAVALGLMSAPEGADDDTLRRCIVEAMHDIGNRYPNAGYGGRFRIWLFRRLTEPYYSYGNGSAMRVSSAAWLFNDIDSVRRAAPCIVGKRPPGSKYRSTSGPSPREHLERQAEFHASTQDEA